MNPVIFEIFKNENLTKPLVVLKRIGQVGVFIAALGVAIIQLNKGVMGGTPVLDFISFATGWGFIVAMICFAIVGLVSMGKTKHNNTAQAMGRTLLKIFLYLFLPAIIITLILVFAFILPRYQ